MVDRDTTGNDDAARSGRVVEDRLPGGHERGLDGRRPPRVRVAVQVREEAAGDVDANAVTAQEPIGRQRQAEHQLDRLAGDQVHGLLLAVAVLRAQDLQRRAHQVPHRAVAIHVEQPAVEVRVGRRAGHPQPELDGPHHFQVVVERRRREHQDVLARFDGALVVRAKAGVEVRVLDRVVWVEHEAVGRLAIGRRRRRERSARTQVQRPRRRRHGPCGLGAPAIGAHHEQPHGRLGRQPAIDASGVQVAPVEHQRVVVESGRLAEVAVAHLPRCGLGLAVHPRPDDEPGRARLGRASAGAQAGKVARRADRPVALVVPAAEIEDRHLHARVAPLQLRKVPVGPVIWMVQPLVVERRDAGKQRMTAKRHAPQRVAAVLAPPRARVTAGLRPADVAAPPVVRRDVVGRPRQPRQVERAAEVEELSRGRKAHGRERARQVRWCLDGRQPLHGARIRQAGGRDPAVRPRLRRNPLDRVVAVVALVLVGIERAGRIVPATHVLHDDRVAALDGLEPPSSPRDTAGGRTACESGGRAGAGRRRRRAGHREGSRRPGQVLSMSRQPSMSFLRAFVPSCHRDCDRNGSPGRRIRTHRRSSRSCLPRQARARCEGRREAAASSGSRRPGRAA